MKVIFTYSIPHTGTHFIMDLQRQGITRTKWSQVDDMWFGNRFKDGTNYEDFNFNQPIDGRQFQSLIKNHAKQDDKVFIKWNDLDLLLIKGHHWHRNKPLMEALKKADPRNLSVVSPLRDPFLAMMTRSWQGWYGYGKNISNLRPEKDRQREARRITQTFVDMLTMQPIRTFLFPIDGDQSKTVEGRNNITKRLYKHCGLEMNYHTQLFIDEWKPVNTSEGKSKSAGQTKTYNKFEKMKEDYKNGNIKAIQDNKFCNFEFNFIQKEEWLKKLLENAGYSNLLWW